MPARNRISIAARIAQPWRVLPTALPKHQVSPDADREDREHLDEVGQRVRVFERMRRNWR